MIFTRKKKKHCCQKILSMLSLAGIPVNIHCTGHHEF